MVEQLKSIINDEIEAVVKLIKLLEEQHQYLVDKDAFNMEASVKKIQTANKKLAEKEVERRKLTNGKAIKEIISEYKDMELEDRYRKIKRYLNDAQVQKENNEFLIKQGISFTNRMLSIMNPSREMKTYNSYGKIKK